MSAFTPAGYPNFTGASVNTPTVVNHIATYTNSAGNLSNDPATAVSAGNIQAGISGIAGTLASYPAAPATGLLVVSASSNVGNTLVTVTNASMAQTSTITIPDPGSSTGSIILSNTLTSYTTGQNITGIVNITGTATSISPLTGSLVISGGLGLSNNLYVGTSGSVFITRTNDSTSVTSGSLVISGGLGVSGTLYSTYASITNSTIASASITSASITSTTITSATIANALITSATIGNLFVTGSSNLKSLTNTIVQTAHGFSVGNWLYLNGSVYTLALDTSSASSEIVGVVSSIIDANTFSLTMGGLVSGLSGLATGSVYYLGTVSGLMTTLSEATVGSINKPVFVANSSTSGYINNYRGEIIPNSNFNIGSGTIGTFISSIATIGTLNVSTSTIGTLISTIGSIGTLISTTGSVGTLNVAAGSIGTLISTIGSIGTLISTIGSVGTLISTIGSMGTLISTSGSVSTLISTIGTIGTLTSNLVNVTSGTIGGIYITKSAQIATSIIMPTTTITDSSTVSSSSINITSTASNTSVYTQVAKYTASAPTTNVTQQGYICSISMDSSCLASAAYSIANLPNPASVYVFNQTSAGYVGYTQTATLIGSGQTGLATGSSSCACDETGSTIVVGNGGDNFNNGAVWVFTRSSSYSTSTWTQQGNKLIGTGSFGSKVAISGASDSGNTIAIGASSDNATTGSISIFTRSSGVWTLQQKIVGTGYISYPYQGSSVALSADGNTCAFGGPNDNGAIGIFWIWKRSSGIWSQQFVQVPTGLIGNAHAGATIALSSNGNTCAVGCIADNSNIGAAYIYTRSGTIWTQVQKLVPTGYIGTSIYFGIVSLSGDGLTVFGGGAGDNSNLGAVWIWTLVSGIWVQQQKFVPTGSSGNTQFGYSVSTTSNGLNFIAGSPYDSNTTGAITLSTRNSSLIINGPSNVINGNFTVIGGTTSLIGAVNTSSNITVNGSIIMPTTTIADSSTVSTSAINITSTVNNTTYSQVAKYIALTPTANTLQQGSNCSISMDASCIASASYGNGTSNPGSVYVFNQTSVGSTGYVQTAILIGSGQVGTITAQSSCACDETGTTIAVGSLGDNSSKGAVWVFTRSSSYSNATWAQQGNKLVPSGALGTNTSLGYKIAISGTLDSGNTIAAGGYTDNSGIGAVWIYTRTAGAWTQQQKIVGLGYSGSAGMGTGVALSADGNTCAFGGYNNNGGIGALWVWTRLSGIWSQQTIQTPTGLVGLAQAGICVSLSSDGNTCAVSCRNDGATAIGALYIYTRTGIAWNQIQRLVPTGYIGTNIQVGQGLGLSGDGLSVFGGGPQDNSATGAVWIWTLVTGTWVQQQKFVPSGTNGSTQFGTSVCSDRAGLNFIAGSPADYNNSQVGAITLVTKSAGTITENASVIINGSTNAINGNLTITGGTTTINGLLTLPLLGGQIITITFAGASVSSTATSTTILNFSPNVTTGILPSGTYIILYTGTGVVSYGSSGGYLSMRIIDTLSTVLCLLGEINASGNSGGADFNMSMSTIFYSDGSSNYSATVQGGIGQFGAGTATITIRPSSSFKCLRIG